jgi:hypothetical protein
VAADVAAGSVTRETAARFYGVVVGDDGNADEDGTSARRAEIREERRAGARPGGQQ